MKLPKLEKRISIFQTNLQTSCGQLFGGITHFVLRRTNRCSKDICVFAKYVSVCCPLRVYESNVYSTNRPTQKY